MKEIVLAGTPIEKQNDLLPVVQRLEKHQKRRRRASPQAEESHNTLP